MPTARAAKLMLLVIGAAPVLAGCGHIQAVGRARVVQLALSEYRLSPGALRMRSGPITLVVRDFGQLAHNLAIRRGTTTIAETPPIQPGMSVTLSASLIPGSYTLSSTLFDDQSLGIRGKLTVTS